MKSNGWLTVFAVMAILLIGASGFFCFASYKKYTTARDSWDRKIGVVESLEKKPLYPSPEHVNILTENVDQYSQSVKRLFSSLDRFQKPLNKNLASVDFQEKVKSKVNDFSEFAEAENFVIEQADSFQLGFDVYSNSFPIPEIVPILDYELTAIDHLLRKIVKSGAESMEFFTRDLIPGEVGGAGKQESGVVHKYPVRLKIRSSHRAFQSFMNSISNDKEYFYVVRVLNVENEVKEGPLKEIESFSNTPSFSNDETGQPAGIEELTNWGWPDAPEADLIRAAAEDGFSPSGRDARVLMGQEKLNIFMVIDVVRFLDSVAETN